MNVERAKTGDIDELMSLFDAARAIMRSTGNSRQWPEGYPVREKVLRSIEEGKCYVVRSCDGRIHGTFHAALEDDPTYHVIEEGAWLSDSPYVVIHRIAQDGSLHGLFSTALSKAMEASHHIRIDTHEDNVIMRHLLSKEGFTQVGIIHVDDGTARLAFERL